MYIYLLIIINLVYLYLKYIKFFHNKKNKKILNFKKNFLDKKINYYLEILNIT